MACWLGSWKLAGQASACQQCAAALLCPFKLAASCPALHDGLFTLLLCRLPPLPQVWQAEHKGVQQELVDEGDQAAVS